MTDTVQKQFALVGSQITQSISPLIHRELGKTKGIDLTYRLLPTDAAALAQRFQKELVQLDGFNVTMPHKTAILPLLDTLSPRAALYGAVNTVYFAGSETVGANTDCEGFLRAVKAANIAIGGNVLIAGCGGVARMFAYECLAAGASVTLAVRDGSQSKAAALQRELAAKTGKTLAITGMDGTGSYDLLINATPLGKAPHTAESPFTAAAVQSAGAVFDAVYNPPKTKLLQLAEAAGVPCLNGLPMLVWQAAAAEELWNGVVFTETEVNAVMALAEKELNNR